MVSHYNKRQRIGLLLLNGRIDSDSDSDSDKSSIFLVLLGESIGYQCIPSQMIRDGESVYMWCNIHKPWWRHQMETFSALLALCVEIRSTVNSRHKGQWRGLLMTSLICTWTNCWVNNRDTDDLRGHHAHYDATVMETGCSLTWFATFDIGYCCLDGPQIISAWSPWCTITYVETGQGITMHTIWHVFLAASTGTSGWGLLKIR